MTDRLSNAQSLSLSDVSAEALKSKSAGRVPATQTDVSHGNALSSVTLGQTLDAAVASISPEALTKLNAEREAVKFGRTAARITDAGEQPDLVRTLKAQFESGKIEDYLSQLDSSDLANSLINSPVAGFLTRQVA
jgi:hypothetical protein